LPLEIRICSQNPLHDVLSVFLVAFHCFRAEILVCFLVLGAANGILIWLQWQ
jgi:hypothetical protein